MHHSAVPPGFIIATSKQGRAIDASTTKDFGIDGFTLMEVAGSSTAKHLLKKLSAGEHGIFICGKGNNAGDALVVARYLIQHQISATIILLSGDADLSSDTQKNLTLLNTIAEKDPQAGTVQILTSWNDFDIHSASDFIIDGILGTGLSSNLRDHYLDAVTWANQSGLSIYSIDIPTGLHADSGKIMGCAVKATTTFTYGVLKQGFYLNEGHHHTGQIVFCELPFPNYLKTECSSFLIDEKWIKKEQRELPDHKYNGGVLYIIAGSKGLTGAAIMAAKSAWAEGLGAVIIITPEGNLNIYEKNLPQIIKKIVGSEKDFHFNTSHLKKVLQILNEKKGTLLIGPGLGRKKETIAFTQTLLQKYIGEVVIDADALFALARQKSLQKPAGSEWILTPHPGELSKLLKINNTEDPERLESVREFAKSNGVTLASKGFPVIIGTPQGNIYLTSYDTRKFSRAGFGDVLAGKISACRALCYSPLKSCVLGLLNGKQKMIRLTETESTHIPEPADLI